MLFNSYEFPVFLGLVVIVYHLLPHRGQNRWLVAASYVFYGWWDWRFLFLLAISTAVDFTVARAIGGSEDARYRKRMLYVSLATNLGILGCFKYFGFFVESATSLLATLGWSLPLPVLEVILPVGISFYTFQTLGYTIDVFRDRLRPCEQWVDFALYVSFFPQLVAGPIERARSLLPQLQRPRHVGRDDLSIASQLILLGFFKKLCIADVVAPYVDAAFANPGAHSAGDLAFAVYLFALQIYGDFSGYTDIARGVARLFGIRLSVNFRQPYLATDITDFWRRWHISLSTWLRDYLYIPLGGNRSGGVRTYRNLAVTMLLGGLWHGAAWNFVAWGGLHGAAVAAHRALTGATVSSRATSGSRVRALLSGLLTFHFVCFAWVFFRAASFGEAQAVLAGMLSGGLPTESTIAVTAWALLALLATDLSCWSREAELPVPQRWPAWAQGAVFAGLVFCISFVGTPNVRPFIYFQF